MPSGHGLLIKTRKIKSKQNQSKTKTKTDQIKSKTNQIKSKQKTNQILSKQNTKNKIAKVMVFGAVLWMTSSHLSSRVPFVHYLTFILIVLMAAMRVFVAAHFIDQVCFFFLTILPKTKTKNQKTKKKTHTTN